MKSLSRLIKGLAVLPVFMAMGATPATHNANAFVANAGSLAPVSVPATPQAVVVTEVRKSQPPSIKTAPAPSQRVSAAPSLGLGGILSGNNCVACVRQMTGRSQNGNAGTWNDYGDHHPDVGDIMIWRPGQMGAGSAGHVAVVVGVDGDRISVKHCNWGGGQTVFSSTGHFW